MRKGFSVYCHFVWSQILRCTKAKFCNRVMVETDRGSSSETQKPGTFCPESVMKLTVQNPVTRTTDTGRYTTYEITLETTHISFTLDKSCVRRRYSDIVWLRSRLHHNYPDRILPAIPPKKFFSARFGADVIERRRLGCERFLQGLLEEGAYLSEGCLHLFLQTPLSVEEITECVKTHSNAADIIRTVDAFSVTSSAGERVLYCHDNCSVHGSSRRSTLQTPDPRVCCLVARKRCPTSGLSDSSNSQSMDAGIPSASACSAVQGFDDKSDSSVASSASHSGDSSVPPQGNRSDSRNVKATEKVTFSELVDMCNSQFSDGS